MNLFSKTCEMLPSQRGINIKNESSILFYILFFFFSLLSALSPQYSVIFLLTAHLHSEKLVARGYHTRHS